MNIKLETLVLTRYNEKKHKNLKEELENGESSSKFIHQIAQNLENSKNNFSNIFQSSFVIEHNDISIGYLYISSNKNDEVFLECSLLKQFRSKGYGTILLNQVSDYLFENHNIKCIKADVNPSNKKSMAMLCACGYLFDEEEYESRNFIGNMQFFKESDCYVSKRRK